MGNTNLYCFGPPRLERQGERVNVTRRKTMALITYLAVTAQEHTRDHLVALLWPDYDSSSAYANLRRELFRLKDVLGPDLASITRDRVHLPEEADLWLDVRIFRQSLNRVRQHAHRPEQLCPVCLSNLQAAVDLYQDDFLQGFSLADSAAFDDWHFFEAQGMRSDLAEALAILVQWHANQGEFERGGEYARRWVEMDSLFEDAQRWLMKMYAWSGQAAAAGRLYEELVERLDKEVGVPPEPETGELWESIRSRRLAPPTPRRQPATATLDRQPLVKLPTPEGHFIGRAAELAQLSELLLEPEARLVTLVGFGGVGKTRLALEAAQQNMAAFPDGVVFVPLASLEKVEALPSALARTLECPMGGQLDTLDEVNNFLKERRMLLVLDNFEQLLDGAPIVKDLLRTGPGIRLLVTSREPLYLDLERRLDVEGLSYPADGTDPEAHYDAVDLFLEAARLVKGPSYAPQAAEILEIHRLCRMVAGMPLALKLAAAWLRMMDISQVVQELERNLDLLTSRVRDVPERQRSLRVIFDSTWGHLPPAEQNTLLQLSVFGGTFDQPAAEAVASATTLQLAGLVDRGLVQFSGEGRYEMHALTRQFGREKLQASGHEPEVVQRFGCYHLGRLAHQLPELHSAQSAETLKLLGLEMENYRQAWKWACQQGQWDMIALAADALAAVYELSGFLREGEQVFKSALEALAEQDGEPESRLVLECQLSMHLLEFCLYRGSGPKVLPQLEALSELAERSGDAWCQTMARYLLGLGHLYWDDNATALSYLEAAVAEFEAAGDLHHQVEALNNLAECVSHLNRPQEALNLLADALVIGRRLGNIRLQALTYSHMGVAYYYADDFQQAVANWERALHTFDQLKVLRDIARTSNNLGFVYHMLGLFDEAQYYAERALNIFVQVGDHRNEANTAETLGAIHQALGDYRQARHYLERSLVLMTSAVGSSGIDEIMIWTSLAEVDIHTGNYARARTHLATATQLIEEYTPIKEYTRIIGMHAELEAALGNHAAALERYDEALNLLEQHDEHSEHARLTLHKGSLLLELGELEAAANCLELAGQEAQMTSRLPVRFEVGIGLARLQRARGDPAGALSQLAAIEQFALTQADRAVLAYERWIITGDRETGYQSQALYQQLADRAGGALFRRRAQELAEALD